jgi:CheY-like chemotaxis protein
MKGKRVKLLIVDDEKDICGFAKLLFRKKGFLAYSALSGVGALRLAKKIKPDIALLDIHLRGAINGIEVLDLLRQSLPDCRCVMVTWDKEQAKMKEAKKLGAVSYLTKPLTTAQLLRVIDAVAKGIRKRG